MLTQSVIDTVSGADIYGAVIDNDCLGLEMDGCCCAPPAAVPPAPAGTARRAGSGAVWGAAVPPASSTCCTGGGHQPWGVREPCRCGTEGHGQRAWWDGMGLVILEGFSSFNVIDQAGFILAAALWLCFPLGTGTNRMYADLSSAAYKLSSLRQKRFLSISVHKHH